MSQRDSSLPRLYGGPLLAFVLTLAVGLFFIQAEHAAWHQEQAVHTTEMAATQATALERRLSRSLSAAYILGTEAQLHRGDVHDFEARAADLMASVGGITNLQLAPGGIVRHIYPLVGHEMALGHNILRDDGRRSDAHKAIQTKQLTLAGPFELVQGGVAVIGRYPVFINDTAEEERFWGFTSVLIDLGDLIAATDLPLLSQKDYHYQLSHLNPDTGREEVFAGSLEGSLENAVTFDVQLPNQVWTLSVSPIEAGGNPLFFAQLMLVLLLSLLVAYVVYLMLKQPIYLKQLIAQRTKELEKERALLARTKTRLEFLLSSTSAVTYTRKPRDDYGVTFVSANIPLLLGYQPREFTASPGFWADHLHPEDREKAFSELPELFQADQLVLEYRFRLPAGDYRWIRDELRLVRDGDGNMAEIVGFWIDIDERKQAENDLRDSEQRYRQLFVANQAVMLLIDPADGAIVDANQAASGFYGYSIEQLKALKISDINALSKQQVLAEMERARIQARNHFRFPHRLASREIREVEVYSGPVNIHGRQLLYSIIHDISRRVQAEAKLRTLSRAIEQSPASVVITDPEGAIEYVNPRFEQITGYRQEEVIGETPKLLKSGRMPPEVFRELWETITQGRQWQGEFLNKKRDGELFWESASISPILNEKQEIIHFVGVTEDISERKQIEESRRIAAAVFDNAAEAILVTDAQSKVVAVNPMFTTITGYAADEILGKSPRLLNSGRHDEAFYCNMWESLEEIGQWQGEIWNRRKNGEIYPEWLSITAIRDADYQIVQYVALFSDITQRKRDEQNIWHQANFDPLTGLPNRSLFQDRLARALAHAYRHSKQVALMFIDLDRFKWVNDTLGHKAGDLLLQEAARRLTSCARGEDTVARLGGDEFTVILQDLHTASDAEVVAQKLLDALASPFILDEQEAFVSGSIGVTLYPEDGDNVEQLLKNADTAMYRAKDAGRSRYRFYTEEMNLQALLRLKTERDLRRALDQDQLEIHYQPIIDLASGHIASVEALLRWQHPEHGLVTPDQFIPLAEETGLITGIGEWVLEKSCRQMQSWLQRGLFPSGQPSCHLSINVSAVQFRESGCVEKLAGILSSSGLRPDRLILEITENVILESNQEMTAKMQALRALKIGIALDDFGTGYSSLSYLKRFPVDILKIDRSYIQEVIQEAESAALVEAIVVMAHRLGLQVVAEGVETAAQLDFLRNLDCGFAQGYRWSRPLPVSAFEQWAMEYGQAERCRAI